MAFLDHTVTRRVNQDYKPGYAQVLGIWGSWGSWSGLTQSGSTADTMLAEEGLAGGQPARSCVVFIPLSWFGIAVPLVSFFLP